MAITSPIAGAYTGAWNSVALNYTRQGFNLNFTVMAEQIDETDLYGQSLIDMVYRGARLSIDTICKIYGTGSTGPLSAWAGVFGKVYSAALPIAQLASTAAKALVLTAVANTPAASSPATFTATKSIISPGQNFQLIFSSVHREVPLRFDVLLVDDTGTGSLWLST